MKIHIINYLLILSLLKTQQIFTKNVIFLVFSIKSYIIMVILAKIRQIVYIQQYIIQHIENNNKQYILL
jgi:hypothetical protein